MPALLPYTLTVNLTPYSGLPMRTLLLSIFIMLATGFCASAQTGDTHPATGKYNVYDNGTVLFDFTLIRKSSPGRTGLYELSVGKDGKDRGQSSGEYQYDPDTKTITWLSGPFTSDQYKPGANNREAGKVLQKGSSFIIVLNNNLRANN
jgi:hypothetical protein